MKNPYHDQLQEDEVSIGRRGLLVASGIFALILVFPWLVTLVRDRGGVDPVVWSDSTIRNLKAMEKWVEGLPVFERARDVDQAALTKIANVGNRKVVLGQDGWLFYRPDLDAVVGNGPFYNEPPSVSRERVVDQWRPPLPEILDFAAHLKKRNIELVLVPVPTKPMVCNSALGLDGEAITNKDWDDLKSRLEEAGVRFVDLLPLLASMPEEERFLKQDTHWTPEAMERAAARVAEMMPSFSQSEVVGEVREVKRGSKGDLARMLVPDEIGLFEEETVSLRVVEGGPRINNDESTIVVLGDSFVNVYEDPELGFAGNGEREPLSAGFSSHLARHLGVSIQTIAINGGGATEVRKNFARLGGNSITRRRVVVWVLSARDVLLPELPARRAGIKWEPVEYPVIVRLEKAVPEEKKEGAIRVTATLKERTRLGDPKETPYDTAIYSAVFEAVEGDAIKEYYVFLWGFRKREMEPTAFFSPGQRYELTLVPLQEYPEAMRATQLDDFSRFDLTPFFATDASEMK